MIYIIGAGGHGRVVFEILKQSHPHHHTRFLDADQTLHGSTIDGAPVIGDIDYLLSPHPNCPPSPSAIVAIGDNTVRLHYANLLARHGVNLISAIHPSAIIASSAHIGKNVVIACGAKICAHARVEDSAIANTGCIIEHQSWIMTAAHICPGVRMAGHVTIRPAAFVGIGATIIQGITIGKHATIGAGSVILHDVSDHTTVAGVPARPIKHSPPKPTENQPALTPAIP